MLQWWSGIKWCVCVQGYEPPSAAQTHREPAWQGRSIGTTKLRLVEFSSFLETQRDQEAVSYSAHMHTYPAPDYNKHSLLSHKQRWQITPQQRTALKPFVCRLVWITFVKLYLSVCSVYLSSCHAAYSLPFFYLGLIDSWHSSCCFLFA